MFTAMSDTHIYYSLFSKIFHICYFNHSFIYPFIKWLLLTGLDTICVIKIVDTFVKTGLHPNGGLHKTQKLQSASQLISVMEKNKAGDGSMTAGCIGLRVVEQKREDHCYFLLDGGGHLGKWRQCPGLTGQGVLQLYRKPIVVL